jgi:Family of unknown function (DUF6355)
VIGLSDPRSVQLRIIQSNVYLYRELKRAKKYALKQHYHRGLMRGFPFPLTGETNSTRCMAMINKQSKIARLLTSTAIVAGLGLGLAVVPTEKSEAGSGGVSCGFFRSGNEAFYQHCTGRVRTVVEVRIDYVIGNEKICVRPGSTVYLGKGTWIKNAYYTGRLCR